MAPNEFQGSVIGGINKRSGIIQNTDMSDDGSGCVVQADVPLAQVSCPLPDLRGCCQYIGGFSEAVNARDSTYPPHGRSTRPVGKRCAKKTSWFARRAANRAAFYNVHHVRYHPPTYCEIKLFLMRSRRRSRRRRRLEYSGSRNPPEKKIFSWVPKKKVDVVCVCVCV